MGLFSYKCAICHQQIVHGDFDGEKCRLQHIRKNKTIGVVIGHYDGSGGVMEDRLFGAEDDRKKPFNPNSLGEIAKSIYELPTSSSAGMCRIVSEDYSIDNYYGDIYDMNRIRLNDIDCHESVQVAFKRFIQLKQIKESTDENILTGVTLLSEFSGGYTSEKKETWSQTIKDVRAYLNSEKSKTIKDIFYKFVNLLPIYEGDSGIIATHEYCYQTVSKEKRADLPFSLKDPEQGYGTINPKFT